MELLEAIQDSFNQYAGAVIQSRALPDVRDMLKPSARQVFYSLYTDNFTYDKPFKKTLKAIGSTMRFYIHGDASVEGILLRSAQPFSMRYPLVEVEGSYGNQIEKGNWAAPRYTSSRLSKLSESLISLTTNYNVEEWEWNYDDTEQYPKILAGQGFYNIVNGSSGIAIGLSSSIPQFNIVDVNNAFIKLIKDKNCSFDDVYCAPDFATGGYLINEDEVKESLKNGTGKPAILEAKIDYDKKDNCLIVSELPYGVYTNTICKEVEKLCKEEDIEIEGLNDLTGSSVNIKIYLTKRAKPDVIKEILYNSTSLRKSYSINMYMLKDGKYPQVFGFKECLENHLSFEKETYINNYNYKLKKLNEEILKNEILLKAINHIEEVIKIIKNSNNVKKELSSLLEITEDDCKIILYMKLYRLSSLEEEKLIEKINALKLNKNSIEKILSSEELLNDEIIKGFQYVIDNFGDSRRTKIIKKEIIKIEKQEKEKEKTVPQPVVVTFNPLGYLQNIPIAKYKQSNFIFEKCKTDDIILLFSNIGKLYRIKVGEIKECGNSDKGTAIGSIINLSQGEKIIYMTSTIINEHHPYIIFVDDLGKVKKVNKLECIGNTQNKNGLAVAAKMSNLLLIDSSNGDIVHIESKNREIFFKADDLRESGKTAGGVKGIALEPEEKAISANIIRDKNIETQYRGGKGKIKK